MDGLEFVVDKRLRALLVNLVGEVNVVVWKGLEA